jgi:hypothetical protein
MVKSEAIAAMLKKRGSKSSSRSPRSKKKRGASAGVRPEKPLKFFGFSAFFSLQRRSEAF